MIHTRGILIMGNCNQELRDAPDELIDIEAVARMLAVSARTVRRLSDAGRMPLPLHLGNRLVRWRQGEIKSWIAGGCVAPRKPTTKRGA